MITSAQMRAARAMLDLDQGGLAALAGLSLPTVQRMEGSGGQGRGTIDTLVKIVEALVDAGVALIAVNTPSAGCGRGERFGMAESRPWLSNERREREAAARESISDVA